jgi:hypothetical protein
MNILLTLLGMLATANVLAADTPLRSIYNFFPKQVTCSGSHGIAKGVAGEGGGEIEVHILESAIANSQKAYRTVLCQTLEDAQHSKTAVDLQVRDLTSSDPKRPTLEGVVSIILGHKASE